MRCSDLLDIAERAEKVPGNHAMGAFANLH
jgi:hypothetical protein